MLRSRELHEATKRFPDATTYRVLKPELQGYWQFFGRIDVGEGFFFHAPVRLRMHPRAVALDPFAVTRGNLVRDGGRGQEVALRA